MLPIIAMTIAFIAGFVAGLMGNSNYWKDKRELKR